MENKAQKFSRLASGALRNFFLPAATERRRSSRQDPQVAQKSAGRPAAFIAMGALPVAMLGLWLAADTAESDRLRVKPLFERPSTIPYPVDNVPSAARVELGRRLFGEARLSADNTISCATCHKPSQSFTDGMTFSKGVAKTPLKMHTPSLWNLAWGYAFFWDGRAASIETQAKGPLEHPDEMGQNIEIAAGKLASDPGYVSAFAAAFPESPKISPDTVLKTLATFQRTLVSPMTRFDRWLDGDPKAMSSAEKRGFQLFIGKGGCTNCHSGWAFTDYAFHDIGLQSAANGRGKVIGRAALDQAFKTPTLRELVWTAPEMHDGSLASLEEVVRHYEKGGVTRPTRSPDLPRKLELSDRERQDLVAFLKTLSSNRPAHTPIELASARGPLPASSGTRMTKINQRDKKFQPALVSIKAGESLAIVNDDSQAHNVFVTDPRMSFDSGWQDPGTQTVMPFPEAGDFEAFCGIHPNMRLRIEVAPSMRN